VDEPRILTVPGLWNSGPKHWQTLWEQTFPNCKRVQQTEWATPRFEDWAANIDAAVGESDAPVVFAAHSIGCIAVTQWAEKMNGQVRGALLVAPADTEREGFPEGTEGFRPLRLKKLPFPSIVAASQDDPWSKPERAEYFAEMWGSRFVNIGNGGHINADAGFGPWPAGEQLLQELLGAS
jgi:predicted alpha/beta hydrolase family esterase